MPECRLYPESPWFQKLLRDYLGDTVRFVTRPEPGPREAILVDCIESTHNLEVARSKYPSNPIVGVLAREDAARMLQVLSAGVAGAIALSDPPSVWREALNVVLGGGRWVGGPGVEVKLQHKYASYDVARNDRHQGDVTMRTRLFVKGRVRDRVRD